MAYAAVMSLANTFKLLLRYSSQISLVPPTPEIIESAYEEVRSLKGILERLDDDRNRSSAKRLNALDGQIGGTVYKLEDVIQCNVSNQIVLQSEESIGHGIEFSIDLQDLKKEIHFFTEMLKEMGEDYINELCNPLPEEEEALSSRIGSGGKKSTMVGLSDQLSKMKDMLQDTIQYPGDSPSPGYSRLVLLVGMAGIGKTTLARKIFKDPDILEFFNCHVWVTVGRKYELKEIQLAILAQVDPNADKILMEGDEKIGEHLKESLKGKRCLIVLDDVWDSLLGFDIGECFPHEANESRILITTRIESFSFHKLRMRLLNKEESWELLRENVFGEDLCPPQLEKAGRKIAENCEGLPLMIITIVDFLADKNPQYWNKIAEKQNSVFMDAYDEISKVLYPSYKYLSQHLKMCFLNMGVFPQNYEIPRSKVINMWIAEGLIEEFHARIMLQNSESCTVKPLRNLISNSVVMAYQRRTISRYEPKTCCLHSSFWHLCNREAWKNKFFHILNSREDGLAEDMKSQWRLCMHNNILFGIKDVRKSMEDKCASTARSLLCFGPYRQYPVPIFCGFRLLRVLDALAIRFYEFPMEVLKLFLLRYLALTYNGDLPASISKLWNLHFLIVGRHLSIKPCGALSCLPMEIWDMKELMHLQVMGTSLLQVPNSDASLENLSTLLDVSPRSCTKGVLRRIPRLKKLGIRIELTPDDNSMSLHCLNHIYHHSALESLKCVVVNPEFGSEFVRPPPPHSLSRSHLQKLHLNGLGYPWEYMSIIASMPHLTVLKLRLYAFRGPKWEVQDNTFMALKFLLIEDTDLVQWKIGGGSFPRLGHLSIKHCYKLKEIHGEFAEHLQTIELLDCNPLCVTCAKEIKEAQSREGYHVPDVHVYSSWDDGNLKHDSQIRSFKRL